MDLRTVTKAEIWRALNYAAKLLEQSGFRRHDEVGVKRQLKADEWLARLLEARDE